MSLFNTCIITAHSMEQARIYGELIRKRLDHGLYPSEVEFRIYSDPSEGSVGSGGATLLALNKYMEEAGWPNSDSFRDHRILIINAGGLKPRIPCFASEGILFTPVPLDSSSIIPPVVLDLQLSLFLKYPWKKGEVVVIPGDVIADFDTSILSDQRGDVCGFAAAASFEKGASHGVFRFDSFRRNVVNYFQKADPEYLRRNALLEGTQKCALDMGIVSLSPPVISSLLEAGQMETGEGKLLDCLAKGGISFDLYLEFLTAALTDVKFSSFSDLVQPFTSFNEKTLSSFFDIFRRYNLCAILTRNSTFLHLSSPVEYMQSCMELQKKELRLFYSNDFEELRVFSAPEQIRFNCIDLNLPVGRKRPVLAEGMENCKIENVLGANLLTGITGWSTDTLIPEGICVDQRETGDGPVKVIYGLEDTFRALTNLDSMVFCGVPIEQWLKSRKLLPSDIWQDGTITGISSAELFCVNSTDEFLEGYWSVPQDMQWVKTFRAAKRFSLNKIDGYQNGLERERNRQAIRTRLLRRQILSGMGWNNTGANDFVAAFSDDPPLGELKKIYDSTDEFLLRSYRRRLYEQVARSESGDLAGFEFLKQGDEELLLKGSQGVRSDRMILVESPVRVDIAGGWTDTPPFTLRNGGAVVNLAVDLYNRSPVQVFCKASPELCIRLVSIDLGAAQIIRDFTEIADYGNSPLFALPKAALYMSGFNSESSGFKTLRKLLEKLGHGIEISMLCGVPCGSGLGASSILASAILAAINEFFGISLDSKTILKRILILEKMLSLGGGWQDTLGGITGGLKYIESRPSLNPDPVVYQLDPSIFIDSSSLSRFTLYYTGIKRPERNIIREVAGTMDGNTPAYLFTLRYLKQLAAEARDAVGLRDFTMLAGVLNAGRLANIKIHSSATNSELESVINRVKPFYRAVKLAGAGGGGYALFCSDSPEEARILRENLEKTNSGGSRVVPFKLNTVGLQVSVL